MQTLERQDLVDILYGAAIMGTGGGGEIVEGLRVIDDALAKGKIFRLASLDEAPDDALICTPYMLGAISALPPEEEVPYARLPRIKGTHILTAYDRFQRYLGREFYGTVPCELGGSNTAYAFYAAAMNDAVMLDADPAGRAVPEITHSTYYIAGLPAAPIVMANEFGETMICENVMDDMRAEVLVRALCKVSRNDIAAIDHALELRELRDAIIPGTISQAMRLGRVWREALEEGADVAEAIAAEGAGRVAFRGQITRCDWRTEEGFTLGQFEIAGQDESAGQTYRVALKNENMVAWRDEVVDATIPDLICMIDVDTGAPVTNPNYHEGQNVAIILLPAPTAFRTEKGLATFGPGYAGVDEPFRPAIT